MKKRKKKKISNSSEDLSTRMNLTIYNSYTAQACVLVILSLYQSLEYPVQLIGSGSGIIWPSRFMVHCFFF